jgi:hypothetical protein
MRSKIFFALFLVIGCEESNIEQELLLALAMPRQTETKTVEVETVEFIETKDCNKSAESDNFDQEGSDQLTGLLLLDDCNLVVYHTTNMSMSQSYNLLRELWNRDKHPGYDFKVVTR